MNIKQKNKPDFLTWQDDFKNNILANINCVRIGRIESFNPLNQTTSVQLMQKGINQNIDKVIDTEEFSYPLLTDCPVFVLSGGNSSIQMPISKGDFCVVLFNDRMIDDWWLSGIETKPTFLRMHDLSDGLVLVGICPNITPISNYTTDGIVIESDRIKLGTTARKGDTVTITKAQWTAANPQTSQGPVTISNDLQFTITSGSSKVFSG